MSIASVAVAATTTTLLTAASECAVLGFILCNTTTSAKVVTLYTYASGGSASDTTTILKEVSIPAKDSFCFPDDTASLKLILDTGGVVSAIADVVGVSATVVYKLI